MTEYVCNIDLYVLADSLEEAERITHGLVEEVLSRPEVVRVKAEPTEKR